MDKEEKHLQVIQAMIMSTLILDNNPNNDTVIPWFTRLLWQPENRVNQKSCYTSHSIKVKKLSKKLLLH